jgi:putative PEP-CTERM system integral membrane protein
MKSFLTIFSQTIFWFWNIAFLLIVYAGIMPYVGFSLAAAVTNGEIEVEFLLTLIATIATPTICTIIGWKFLRKRPLELMRLFYGVEAPLLLLCVLRLFVLRELTPASNLILITVAVCTIAFLGEVIYGYSQNRKTVAWMQAIAHSLMVLVGLYEGLLLLFYAVPFASVCLFGLVAILIEFFSFRWLEGLWWSIVHNPIFLFTWLPLSFIFFCLSCALFLGMPSTLTALYIQSSRRIFKNFSSQYGRKRSTQVFLAVVSAWLVLFIAFYQQPQIKAFALLENKSQTNSDRAQLIAKSSDIRQGLVNAYLYPYRYLSTAKESNQIKMMYRDTFGFPSSWSRNLQNSFNLLISPFLYRGDENDDKKAEQLYAQFFDTPIQKGEKQAVRKALQSTAIVDDAKAGVLNINQKKVWLKKQEVNLKEHGNWADVEIHEVYENQTFDVEEIFYSFSLPESAVITGLWLGDTDNLQRCFPFQITTRGAAQKVYNSQVRRERPVDPALLEQVGPRQYRLRAFPIPAKLRSWQQNNSNNRTERPTQMHLWLTYKVMQQDGKWQLPQLTEKRNIFWTNNTQRFRNGKKINLTQENWLEISLTATKQQPQLQQITFAEGYRIISKPLSDRDYVLPNNKRLAILVDTSRSMEEHREDLKNTFSWLRKISSNNNLDIYLTSAIGMQPQRLKDLSKLNFDRQIFYGTLQIPEMLRQFSKLRGESTYDGILLLTDRGSYELADNKKDFPAIHAPLWLVHLGTLAPAYPDTVLKAIEDSNGGVSTEISPVLQNMATKAKLGNSAIAVVDGYAWSIEEDNNLNPVVNKGFEPIAARLLVRGLSKQIKEGDLTKLDSIHAIAKTYKIITPFSSAIVLVNDEQRELLRQAEAQADRFDRKLEDGKESLNKPNNPLNVARIPEPSPIVGLIAIALFFFVRRRISK